MRGKIPNNQRRGIDFTVTIPDCSSSIPTPAIAIITDFYTINDPLKSILFTDFIPTVALCAPFTYTATQIDGITPIDSTLFTFFAASR